MKKKLLTVEDLLKYAASAKMHTFSSKESGYQLAVQIPTTFEIESDEKDAHRGMLKVKIKVFHDGLNVNGSHLSHEAAQEFADTIPDRPVLASIWQNDDGVYDFSDHEIEYHDNNGQVEVEYIEKQIGSFSSSPAFWEYDEELDKNFVCAYAYIPEDYTKAAEILRRKSGTKNSCELIIEEMSYNVEEDYLDFKHGYLSGTTFLGTDPDTGEAIGEGMKGSRADIVEFSVENNSIVNNNAELVEEIKKLNTLLSAFNIKNSEEGGNSDMNEFDENGRRVEDDTVIVPETDPETPEATETPEEPESTPDPEPTPEANPEGDGNEGDGEGDGGDGDADGGESDGGEAASFSVNFELSHDDIRGQLWNALHDRTVESNYNIWYWPVEVYDDHFIYECESDEDGTTRYYRESYAKNEQSIELGADAVEVFAEWLTSEEVGALNLMRSTYQELREFKDNAEATALHEAREAVLNSDEYSVLAENEDFAALVENMDQYSVDELQTRADVIFAKHIKTVGTYSAQKRNDVEAIPNVKRFNIKDTSSDKNDSPYPGLFLDD